MSFPLVVDSQTLSTAAIQAQANGGDLRQAGICLVDLRSPEAYEAGHIPGAVRGTASLLNRSAPPCGGLLPEPDAVNAFLKEVGANMGDQIVAYDGGRETAAARMIWVLDAYGYEATSWLEGGFKGWESQNLTISTDATDAPEGNLELSLIGDNVLSAEQLMELLSENAVKVLDVRTPGEYAGTDVRAERGGHVPTASHLEWTSQLDDVGYLLPDEMLQAQLDQNNISTDDAVVVYCQTHQRSALTYVVLKHLGFENVRALDGAWSTWGNRTDTPIE